MGEVGGESEKTSERQLFVTGVEGEGGVEGGVRAICDRVMAFFSKLKRPLKGGGDVYWFELASTEPHGKVATGSLLYKIIIPAMAEPRQNEFLFLFQIIILNCLLRCFFRKKSESNNVAAVKASCRDQPQCYMYLRRF